MPSFTTTAKWALRRLTGGSIIHDVDEGIAALADDVDALLTPWSSGTLASRPATSAAKAGRRYYATDTFQEYVDTGAGWLAVGKLSARGKINVPPGFGGNRTVTTTIPHGLPTTPAYVEVSDTYCGAGAGGPSSGQDEPVISAVTAVDATDIHVRFFLPDGVTASIGPGPVWWKAEV